ncbi:MAG: hypothetical protein JO115_11405 [Pseudonocardiales bacterium]|nr:hypothetical protein [Pseudonocardiales bacterium]
MPCTGDQSVGELDARLLRDRDWAAVERSFRSSHPFDFVVLDDFLEDAARSSLHAELVQH